MSVVSSPAAENGLAADVKGRVVALVRTILERRSIHRDILDDDDLRDAGLSSLEMVNLMLAVETQFDVKIPDSEMTLRNFRSVSTIETLVRSLLAAA